MVLMRRSFAILSQDDIKEGGYSDDFRKNLKNEIFKRTILVMQQSEMLIQSSA